MKVKVISLIISLTAIVWWLYLMYKVLEHVEGTELMWFLFIVYAPMATLAAILSKLAEWEEA